MLVLWILLGAFCLLLAVGLWAFHVAFLRRRVPDPFTEEGRRAGGWEPFGEQIMSGLIWMSRQQVKPLEVMSYDGKRLFGRLVERENAKGTVIFFHGYRSHYGVDFSASMEFYHQQGYNTLYCDQRAHGLSQGRVITFGIKEHNDVLSWVTYMALMMGPEHPIFISGLSMGAATVLMAADMEFPANVRGIIADCGFTSPGDQLRYVVKESFHLPPKFTVALLNIFTKLLAGFGLDQWSTEQALKESRYPVLLVHGTTDRIVPCSMTERAYAACRSEKKIELFPDAGHGVSYLTDSPRYQQALIAFLQEHNAQKN